MDVGGGRLRVKRLGREADHSHPSSAEVKNKWSYASTVPVCLHGMYRDNVTFYCLVFVIEIQHVFCEA